MCEKVKGYLEARIKMLEERIKLFPEHSLSWWETKASLLELRFIQENF
jgi:hypothetical protein